MKRKNIELLLIILLIPSMILTGCKSGSKGGSTLIDQVELDDTEGIESFSQIYHLYPSPAEMLSIIDMGEMAYDEDLLIPPIQVDQYIDTKAKTLMLGVYMTDLAYAALFGRHEATLDYLDVVRALAEEIRIDEAVDDEMIESARRNVEHLDSLYNISNDAFMNILSYCERNDRSNTVVMLSAGAFAESLFLAVNLIENYEDADYTLQHLADQKFTIENFMTFARGVETDDPNVSSTLEDLKEIQELYEQLDPGSGAVTIAKPAAEEEGEPKKLVIGAGGGKSQPSLTRDEFESLKTAVVKLRTKIIEG